MKFASKTFVAGLILVGSVAFAEVVATDPDVIARKDLMRSNGASIKTLSAMASGDAAFDAAAAGVAKAQLVANAADIPVKFKNNAVDPASAAKPDVWTNWDDFVAKAGDLGTAAAALDTSSLDALKAGVGAVGGACKACHSTYKLQQ